MGTIVGVEDISTQWKDSDWRSLKVDISYYMLHTFLDLEEHKFTEFSPFSGSLG